MGYHFEERCFFRALSIAFLSIILISCVSFRFIKVTNGVDIVNPGHKFLKGKSTLGDVLLYYGAPKKILEIPGKTVLVYERSYYKGGQFAVGVPFSDITGVSLNLTTFGNLLRYDTLLVSFDDSYILTDIAYEKGTDYPFWTSLLRD
jgi:hypothetical protein